MLFHTHRCALFLFLSRVCHRRAELKTPPVTFLLAYVRGGPLYFGPAARKIKAGVCFHSPKSVSVCVCARTKKSLLGVKYANSLMRVFCVLPGYFSIHYLCAAHLAPAVNDLRLGKKHCCWIGTVSLKLLMSERET